MSPAVPGTRARVALLLVSHSRALADGVRELAGQMAPGVLLLAVGGLPDGGLGTDFDAVTEAMSTAAADADGVVVLTDIGSAVLTVESVLDFAEDDVARRVRLADAPFVEGAVAAAVTAHGGGSLDDVLAAAEHAGSTFADVGRPADTLAGSAPAPGPAGDAGEGAVHVTVRNELGLHARPAAVLARLAAGFDAQVLIGGVNAASVLEIMKLGAVRGDRLAVEARGPQAAEAVRGVVEAIEGGFGET